MRKVTDLSCLQWSRLIDWLKPLFTLELSTEWVTLEWLEMDLHCNWKSEVRMMRLNPCPFSIWHLITVIALSHENWQNPFRRAVFVRYKFMVIWILNLAQHLQCVALLVSVCVPPPPFLLWLHGWFKHGISFYIFARSTWWFLMSIFDISHTNIYFLQPI